MELSSFGEELVDGVVGLDSSELVDQSSVVDKVGLWDCRDLKHLSNLVELVDVHVDVFY